VKDGMARLFELDRFLEPHLRRVLASTTDEVVRAQARSLLETMR
jgi:hypothetical protein